MKLPANAVIAHEKVTDYLLVRQNRNDKSAFLETSGYSPANPDLLISGLVGLREKNEAVPIAENQFGRYYEVVGVLRGPLDVGLRVRTIWMTEHLSGVTKFITLIPIEALSP
jgi:hypothetical protein